MFIGNQKIVKLLERQVKQGKISQAYLFVGPESVGKFTLAKDFSEKIIDGEKPKLDLITLEPEIETNKKGIAKEKEIKIEKIKEAQKELTFFPYAGNYKSLIINNAHRMTESAQNALLKILEEPNRTSVIILVTHKEDEIIPTIRSRCQKIQFNLVSPELIRGKLYKTGKGDRATFLSMGRPGLAITMKDKKEEAELLENIWNTFKSVSQRGINERIKLAEELSQNIPETVKKLEFIIWTLHEDAIKNKTPKEIIGTLKIAEEIEICIEQIKNTGINSRLNLENLLLNL